MESFAIPLNQAGGPRVWRLRMLRAVNALFILGLALTRSQLDFISGFFGLYAIVLLLAVIFWPLFNKQYQLLVDDHGVRGQITWRQRIDVPWENLAKAELGILLLELHTTEGKVHTVNLGNLTYQEHQELKPKLKAVLAEHHLLGESTPVKRLS
jgi:hypothetical protein